MTDREHQEFAALCKAAVSNLDEIIADIDKELALPPLWFLRWPVVLSLGIVVATALTWAIVSNG